MKIIKIICSIYITLMCCLYFNTIDIHASSNILSKTFECTLDETEEKKISNITN